MSLNFDFTEVEGFNPNGPDDFTSPWDENKLHPVTDAIIWATMAVGLGRITEDNVKEFTVRLQVVESIVGPSLQWVEPETQEDIKIFLTEEDVRRHIGLRTNVDDINRPAFYKRVFEAAEREANPGTTSAFERIRDIHQRQMALKGETQDDGE